MNSSETSVVMGRGTAGQLLSRALVVIAVLVVAGLVLRLIGAILGPVLPDFLMHDLGAGWQMLYGIVQPAMPAVMAVGILCAIWWVVSNKWR